MLDTDFRSRACGRTSEVQTCQRSVECRYSVEVLHVKSLLPYVEDDVLYFPHLILMECGL